MKYLLQIESLCRRFLFIAAILVGLASTSELFNVVAQGTPSVETEAIGLFNKGQNVHEKGDLKAAISFYEKALQLVPEFTEAELQRGSALLALGRWAEAESSFRKATAGRGDWSLAYSYLGTALARQNKFDEAKSVLKKAIELDADNTPAWIAIAGIAVRTKAAEAELRTLLKKIAALSTGAKPSALALAARSELELALKEDLAAAATAGRVLEIDPTNLPMLAVSAEIALRVKDIAKAEGYIKRIESIDSTAVDLPMLRVRTLIAGGKIEEADRYISSIKSPSDEMLAIKRQLAPSTIEDIPELEKDLGLDPRNIVALSRLCSLYRKSDPLLALDKCKRAADVEPENIDHAIGFAAALIQAKRYPQAASLLTRLVSIAPENQTIRANLATALIQQKLYTDAKHQFRWLTDKQPSNSVAYFFLAIAHDELQEFADAMANYQIFLKLADPKQNQLEIDKVNLRLPTLQRQLDAGKGRKNARPKIKSQ